MTPVATENRASKIRSILEYHKKRGEDSACHIPVFNGTQRVGALKPIHRNLGPLRQIYVNLLAKWRQENPEGFATVFKVTREGTEVWLQKQLLDNPDRILFMVEMANGKPVGHIGLASFDFENNWCEIDSVLRGDRESPSGIMTHALGALCRWAFTTLELSELRLRVFSDNDRAVRLYERCGFREIGKVPLVRVESGTVTKWVEIADSSAAERHFTVMALENPNPTRTSPSLG